MTNKIFMNLNNYFISYSFIFILKIMSKLSNHYYKMSKEEFYNTYKLTDEDKEEIKKTVEEIGLDEETARGLRLNKVYEDSKFLDDNYKKLVKKMLNDMEKYHARDPDYYYKKK